MPFAHHETVRFHHVDAAGIMYFARVFELCHVAMEAAIDATGTRFGDLFDAPEVLLPVVHAEADYRRPLRLGDVVRIEASLEPRSERSILWRYRLVGEDGELRAEAQIVHAAMDPKTHRSALVPPAFVAAVRAVTDL